MSQHNASIWMWFLIKLVATLLLDIYVGPRVLRLWIILKRNILVTKSLPYILNKPLGINLEKWNYQLLKILEIFCPLALQKVCVSVCRLCIGHAWVPPSPSPCASQPLVCLVGCAFMPVGVLLLRWTSGLGKHWVPVRGLGPWMFKTYVWAELRDSGAYSSNLEN